MPEPTDIPLKYKADASVGGRAPIVVIGPNGSGKTRYAHQLASWNRSELIPALRNIGLDQNIPMQSTAQAEQEVNNWKSNLKRKPWLLTNEINYLFAKLMAEDSASAMRFRDAHAKDPAATPETTKLMRLREAWGALFPGRAIKFEGYSPKVSSEYVTGVTEYPAQQMSDGERVALYLAGRVLDASAPVIIVDEPEVHFHSRLAARFWDELEALKPESRFVYVTHDLPFALSRHSASFINVRPGRDPELGSLSEGIPSDVAQSILAAASISIFAHRIVFCEGTESSYDQQLYSAWFHDRDTAVVPVGSCRDVIRCTVTFTDEGLVSGLAAKGIIDTDYWPQSFLDSTPDAIHVLPVHEVESLFCRRGIFTAIARHLGHSETDATCLYDEWLVAARSKFSGGILVKQISERFRCRCEHQVREIMNSLQLSDDVLTTRSAHKEALAAENWQLSPETIFDEEKAVIDTALSGSDEEFLRVLPGKVFFSALTTKLGIKPDDYVRVAVEGLRAAPDSPLHHLGTSLEGVLSAILPPRKINS